MSRPKPNVLLEYHYAQKMRKNGEITEPKTEQVLEAEAVYSVFYNKKPINLRTQPTYSNEPGPKYQKVSFSNPGHAFNLAERLNKLFKTTLFEVVRVNGGEFVTEADIKNGNSK